MSCYTVEICEKREEFWTGEKGKNLAGISKMEEKSNQTTNSNINRKCECLKMKNKKKYELEKNRVPGKLKRTDRII